MSSAIARRRTALFVFMFASGFGTATWAGRTPAVRDALRVPLGGMGLVLLGLSIGSMTGVTASGTLVRRMGARAAVLLGGTVLVAGLAVTAGCTAVSSAPGVFAGLALFGAGGGIAEVALNIEGNAVERLTGRPVLPLLHGCWSLGTLVGGGVGIAATAAGLPVVWHLLAAAALTAGAVAWSARSIDPDGGRAPAAEAGGDSAWRRQLRMWREARVVLIGLVVLAMAFAEGSANDWLPLLMVTGHHTSAATASLTFTVFAAAMTAGRFCGGPVVARHGRVAVMTASAVLAATGIALVILVPSAFAAGAASVLWGLGASLGFPVSISAAGDDPEDAALRVGAVVTIGYTAFLAGPPVLGTLADHVGLRAAMLLVLALVVAAAFLCRPAMRPRHAAPLTAAEARGPSPVTGDEPLRPL